MSTTEKEVKHALYKIPGGRKIKLGDEESVLIFNSYYPELEKQFYMVPPCLSKRESLFKEDKRYTGEVEIGNAFCQTKKSGILISNFSYKNRNQILQSKAIEKFDCDFIFKTENYEIWIIEVRKSKTERIGESIEEKFLQVVRNRNHTLELAKRLFDKEFSVAFENICSCVVAIPDADPCDFEIFKRTETWRSFMTTNPSYKIGFIGGREFS